MTNHRVLLVAATFLSMIAAAEAAEAPEPRTLSEGHVEAQTTGRVSVSFDRAEAKYAIGEVVGLFIDAREDAYVSILTVSPNGGVVQLFPNKFQTDGFLRAGTRVQVPDPKSGARLEVSGPVGEEKIKVYSSAKPMKIFADLGQGGAGMFRSLDGGMDAVAQSVDDARSLGVKISSETRTLTTVETAALLPAPSAPAPVPVPEPVKPKTNAVAAAVPEVKKPAAHRPHRPAKASAAAQPVTNEPIRLELVGKLPAGGQQRPEPVAKLPSGQAYNQAQLQQMQQMQQLQQLQQMQMPQVQMPQMQMPQMQMPQIQMPQVQMPQIQLPGGFQLQMPQMKLPFGRSAERGAATGNDGEEEDILVAEATDSSCRDLLDKLNAAVAAKDIETAGTDADAIAVSAACGQYQVPAQRRIAALRLAVAQDMMQSGKPVGDYEPQMTAAASPQVLWQASASLGEVRFGQRRFAEAAIDYQNAIEIIKNETRTPKAPTEDTIRGLIDRAGQARILAAAPSSTAPEGAFVPAGKDHRSGMLGGIYSSDVRGIVPVSIPVPITFDFNKATFTSVGSQAAQELLEAIKEQKPDHVVLIGHADKRGSDSYNQTLSAARAKAVAAFLQSNGISASIDAEGRGAAEPINLAVSANLTEDDIDALNRRVEWRRN